MITSNTKFSAVSGALSDLKGERVSIQDIIDTVLQINNMKSKTLAKMKSNACYNPSEVGVVPLKSLYVDMTYQRIIRLQKLINKLRKLEGYDMYSAGVVDVAIRPSGDSYVWDGLRRCIMAGLCGLTHVKSSQFVHPMNATNEDCQKQEARYFKSRNADQESMKAEEIFKSEVVYGEPQSLELLKLIKNCRLDIEGLNPGGRVFGGFVEVRDNYFKKDNIEEEYFIESSNIIQEIYPKEVISGYLLTGLAYLLIKNENSDISYSTEELVEALRNYASINQKQTDLIRGRLAGNARGSIAYLIARRVLRDNNGLINSIGLDEESMNLVDEAA